MDEPFSRARRADPGDHVRRAAGAVGPDQARGRLRHPRPGGGHRAGRQGRRDDRRARHGQGGSSTIDLPRPRNVAGDPVRPASSSRSTARSGRRCAPRSRGLRPHDPERRWRRDRHATTARAPVADAMAAQSRPRTRPPPARRARRRAAPATLALAAARARLVVVLLVAGSCCVNAKLIDPFFWGQPTGVWARLRTWVTDGTAQGSLGEQILVTLRRPARLRHRRRSLGVVFGIALGRIRLPRRPARAVHQGRSTRSPGSCSARSSWSPSASASSPRSSSPSSWSSSGSSSTPSRAPARSTAT